MPRLRTNFRTPLRAFWRPLASGLPRELRTDRRVRASLARLSFKPKTCPTAFRRTAELWLKQASRKAVPVQCTHGGSTSKIPQHSFTEFQAQAMTLQRSLQAPTMTNIEQDRWSRVKGRLRTTVGEDVYTSWFARMDLESVH